MIFFNSGDSCWAAKPTATARTRLNFIVDSQKIIKVLSFSLWNRPKINLRIMMNSCEVGCQQVIYLPLTIMLIYVG